MAPLRRRRRCSGPRVGVHCATVPAGGRGASRAVLEIRVRSSCRRREDFTGRGFGRERLRQAR
ncbi:MAG: hypothetical protein QOK19_2719 [Solirubrobacteraceae bacterium]|jgi:hypothetical protein|nr:hypothetical protein [Solirubrobacterales bacterium]MEA2217158.1 hypothetical protein [Solirubrobacteraceae bacterium]